MVNSPPPVYAFTGVENQYKCPGEQCTKSFRKERGLEAHIKHYHPSLNYSPVSTPKSTPKTTPRRTPKIKTPSPLKPRSHLPSESEDDNVSVVSGNYFVFEAYHLSRLKRPRCQKVSKALTRSILLLNPVLSPISAHVAGRAPSSGRRIRLAFHSGTLNRSLVLFVNSPKFRLPFLSKAGNCVSWFDFVSYWFIPITFYHKGIIFVNDRKRRAI